MRILKHSALEKSSAILKHNKIFSSRWRYSSDFRQQVHWRVSKFGLGGRRKLLERLLAWNRICVLSKIFVANFEKCTIKFKELTTLSSESLLITIRVTELTCSQKTISHFVAPVNTLHATHSKFSNARIRQRTLPHIERNWREESKL